MYCIIHKKDKRMDRMESNMEKIFISNIKINKVRHLENIEIKLSDQEAKHLIITGKNGSGKTSLLNSIATFLGSITNSDNSMDAMRCLENEKNLIARKEKHLLPHKNGKYLDTKKKIKALLRKESRFAAFKREYIRENHPQYRQKKIKGRKQ